MRLSTPCLAAALAATLALTSSCSGVVLRPHISQGDPTIRTRIPTERGPESDTATVGTGVAHGTLVRRVCRTHGWSRDWVATAYEVAPRECPLGGGSDSTAYAAVIVRIDRHPMGATLDICADQGAPRGWEFVPLDDAEGSQRCPGAGRDGASAIRRIRRVN